jgi:hypothetical protein
MHPTTPSAHQYAGGNVLNKGDVLVLQYLAVVLSLSFPLSPACPLFPSCLSSILFES